MLFSPAANCSIECRWRISCMWCWHPQWECMVSPAKKQVHVMDTGQWSLHRGQCALHICCELWALLEDDEPHVEGFESVLRMVVSSAYIEDWWAPNKGWWTLCSGCWAPRRWWWAPLRWWWASRRWWWALRRGRSASKKSPRVFKQLCFDFTYFLYAAL